MMDISDLSGMNFESPRPAFISPDVIEGKYLFLDLHPPRRPGLTLVGAGREVCTAAYRMDRPGFEYHTIEFVIGGTWKLSRGEIETRMRPGGIFAYGPGTGYSLRPEGEGAPVKYFLNVAGDAAASRIAACGLADCEVLHIRDTRWIHGLFDQLLDCNRLEPGQAREIGDRLVDLILLRIRSDVWTGEGSRAEGRESYVRCKAFVHDHYLEIASVAEIATRCHIDPAYLARLFKRYSAERPLQLLTRLKTQHAADLILRRNFSVKAAAEAVGFPDPYHFSRVFKRIHGVSPGNIRRR